MNFGGRKIIRLEDLRDFIFRSKLKSFAKSDLKVSMSDGSSLYSNRELPWLYTDSYNGNSIERGTEDVFYDMVLVWSMQYRGGALEPFWENAQIISTFLKKALLSSPKDAPFRGPKKFSLDEIYFEGRVISGKFEYFNKWEGGLRSFKGHEDIFLDANKVFDHEYIGGIIRNKYFDVDVVEQ
jgi:hypothetical protein